MELLEYIKSMQIHRLENDRMLTAMAIGQGIDKDEISKIIQSTSFSIANFYHYKRLFDESYRELKICGLI